MQSHDEQPRQVLADAGSEPPREIRRLSRRSFLAGITASALSESAGRSSPGPPAGKTDLDPFLAERLRRLRPGHPRLHFTAAEAERFRKGPTGKRARYAQLLYVWVERNRDWTPLIGVPDKKFSNTVLEEESAFITNVALAYVLSGRREHLELARSRALAMCESPRDGFNYYSLGAYAAGLARAYDWLHAEWTRGEAERIRTHLARMTRALYEGSFAGRPKAHWWASYPMHHDYWIPVGGFAEAALALLGEVDEAAAWAARGKRLFDSSWSWLGDDGAWHEGVGDWCYAVAPLLMFYGAWRSVTGEDLHDRPWLRHTARYRLYHWLPGDRYIGLNDSFRDGRYGPLGAAACHLLRRLASLFRDGHAQWLADRDEVYDLRSGGKGVQRAPHEKLSFHEERRDDSHADAYCQAWNFLWYDASITPRPPTDLPLAQHFENEGLILARTGWQTPTATVVSFCCAPLGGQRCAERVRAGEPFLIGNLSHTHAAYNGITLFASGEYFVVPPGYARRGSRFENTVAVNGAEFQTNPGLAIRMVAFRPQRDFTYMAGDATAGFVPAARVARYRRHLLLHPDGRLLVFDDLRLHDKEAVYWDDYQWTLHSDPRSHRVTAAGPRLEWRPRDRASPRLTVTILEPAEFAWEHARLDSLDGSSMLEAHRLVRPEWYSDRMLVLALLSPGIGRPPRLVRHAQFLAVDSGPPTEPLVGFALAPLKADAINGLVRSQAGEREVLLFGHDPARPGSYLSTRDGKVR